MKIKLKKLSQKDIEEKKANYDIFVEVKEKKMFESREDVILALVSEYDKNIKSFYNTKQNQSYEKFWTFNRLIHYYNDLRNGRKETYNTERGEDGIFNLKK